MDTGINTEPRFLGEFDKFIKCLLASLAELERENIIERVKAGMQAAKSRGQEIGRPRKVTKELGNIVHQYQ